MDSHEYEKKIRKAKELQRKINSDENERVMGKLITAPLRAVGWLMRVFMYLALLMFILAVVASVIQYAITGDATILEFLQGF